ncbi:sulfatase-like hydrolase/transferase [Cerasicoccus frondis]|uniref:sulfatase-like hydrolase/transferase n=1 Tax=Cerasicoccus frondis TaxID=490090 RepID=UPI0028529376|nr:sulfatase-like hydrolase/transferase [Cerasicoccus frondis]
MNFIVFFTDQQRWDTMGLHGNPMGLTPHLDRLARQGTFFREAVTPQPVCGPARSCIQTGQYATTTGVWRNGIGLKPDARNLGELFSEAGYHTAYIGKWHLSENTGKAAVPAENRRGYAEWLGANCPELVSGPYSARFWDSENDPIDLPGYRSDAQADAAIRFINKMNDSEKPYFLFLSFLEPHHQNADDNYPAPHRMETIYHGNWLPPDLQALSGSSAKDWAGYCAMVKRLDDSLGRVMDALESTGQAEETVVVFFSDHGCHFKTRNAEYKRSPHESSVRIPLAFWGPKWNGGGEHGCPASLVDVAASLLDTAGIAIPDFMEGNSLLPVTRGERGHLPEESFIQFGDVNMPPGRAIRTERWKYAVSAPAEYTDQGHAAVYQELCLYDLQTDPYELRNLISNAARSGIREQLRSRLIKRMQASGEQDFTIITTDNSM